MGNYLKAAASYEDARGTGKTASAVTAAAVTRPNRAPVIDNDDPLAISIDEDITAHTSFGPFITASDADDDPITWTLEGPDAALFQVVQGNLATEIDATFDYETTPSYTFKVKACDPVPACDTITVNISITNRDEAGSLSFNSTSPQTGTALTASLTDPDGGEINIAWQWSSSSTANGTFANITGATAASYTPVADDVGNYLGASASYTDDHGDSKTASAVSDNAVVAAPVSNNAPEFDTETASRSIAENTAAEQNIGAAVTATDADGDTLTYSLGGTDVASFAIVSGSGQLQTKAALNYETKSSYTVRVTATDQSSATDSITVTISVTDVAEAPVISGDDTVTIEVAENTTGVIRTFRAMDADAGDTITWYVEGTDGSSFTISGGVVSVASGTSLDYESAKTSYSITVKASDGALSDTVTVTVDVTNVDEDGTVSFDSTSPAVGTALTASLSDPDGGVTDRTWQWSSSSTSNGTFTNISGATAAAYTPKSTDVGNYLKATASYTDAEGGSKTAHNVTAAAVIQPNRAPAFSDTSVTRSIAENTAARENIGAAVTATDADGDTLTYRLGGADMASFDIVAASGQLQTKAALNYESKSSYEVMVTATDSSNATASITVTISVTNADEAGSVSFNSTSPQAGTALTASLTDPDGGEINIAWQWARSTDGTTAWSDISDATSISYTPVADDVGNYLGASASYTDDHGDSKTASAVSDNAVVAAPVSNRAPEFDTETATRSIAENTAPEQNIGAAVTATDADDDDRLTYTLGGTDVASFGIVAASGQLQTRAALNYETKSSYEVRVTATDQSSATDSITVTISVTNLDEAGSVSFSLTTPITGKDITAELSDPDGGVTGAKWQWAESSSSSGPFTDIIGVAAQYPTITILNVFKGNYLRATVSYTDAEGGSKTASAVTVKEVQTLSIPKPRAPSITEVRGANEKIKVSWTWGDDNGCANNRTVNIQYAYKREDFFNDGKGPVDKYVGSVTGASHTFTGVEVGNYSVRMFQFGETADGTNCGSSPESNIESVTVRAVGANAAPEFPSSETGARSVAENTVAGESIGAAVTATDDDDDILTYSLGGMDAASFAIVAAGGQLQTKAALNHETKASYEVRVTATDPSLATDSITVTIRVTDVTEAPGKPLAPTVTPGSKTSLSVSWSAPGNTGPAITDYDVRYCESSTDCDEAADWSTHAHSGTATTATIASLDEDTEYEVQVRATNAEGTGAWSASGTGTIMANVAPIIGGDDPLTISVPENRTGAIGTFTATDANAGDTITWSREGADASSFTISGGVVSVASGTTLDYESAKKSYSLTVKASDGALSDTVTVTVNVTDVEEAGVVSIDSTSPVVGTALTASLRDPDGGVTGKTWQWSSSSTSDGTFTAISGATNAAYTPASTDVGNYLKAAASYEDARGTGKTASAVTAAVALPNRAPAFNSETAARSVAENTAARRNIGAVVTATDADDDRLTYTLGGLDVASFTIASATGQLQTKAPLNHETKASYTVTVTATDPDDETDSITVTINVTDVAEAPGKPLAPTVASSSQTSLSVNWAAPANTGPAITDYDLQYCESSTDCDEEADWSTHTHDGTATTATIASLSEDTNYQARVRATNAEDTGVWSASGMGTTGTNTAPVIANDDPIEISIQEDQVGYTVIENIIASDADSDPITWSLEGTGSALFLISRGDLATASDATFDYETTPSYTFTVKACDPAPTCDTITVNITIDRVGVVSFDSTAPAVGTAVTAILTDPDGGVTDTVWRWSSSSTRDGTFTGVSGGNQASYTPVSGDVGNFLEARVFYTDAQSTGRRASAVTAAAVIQPNRVPVFSSDSTIRAVAENTATGTDIGDAVDGDGRGRRHIDLHPKRHGRGLVRHCRVQRAVEDQGASEP